VTTTWPHGDPRDIVQAILADPAYAPASEPSAARESLIARALHWIGQHLRDFFHAVGHVLGVASGQATLIGALVVLASIPLIIVGIFRLVDRWVKRRPSQRRARRVAAAAASRRRGRDEWLELARAAAREERWRDASAALVGAMLASLDASGRLPYDPARTPGEARRLLRDPAFDAFARDADLALFADHAATAERFDRMYAALAAADGVR
jgi:hypothetical protein